MQDVLNLEQWRGQKMVGRDGSRIGKIDEIYLDSETRKPEWALVNTGMITTSYTFVPLAEASVDDNVVRVPYDKSQVKDAPSVVPDAELTAEQERELYRHYGLEYTEARSDSGLPEGTGELPDLHTGERDDPNRDYRGDTDPNVAPGPLTGGTSEVPVPDEDAPGRRQGVSDRVEDLDGGRGQAPASDRSDDEPVTTAGAAGTEPGAGEPGGLRRSQPDDGAEATGDAERDRR